MSVCTYQAEVVVSCLLLRCTEIEHRMRESEGGFCASKHVGGYVVSNTKKITYQHMHFLGVFRIVNH